MSELHKESTTSEKQYKKVFKIIPNPIYLFERVENNLILIDYNESAKTFSEGKIDEYLGLKMSDLYPEHLDLIEEFKYEVDIKGHLSKEIKFKTRSTGLEKTINIELYKIPPNLVMAHMHDITAQRQAEDAFRKSERDKSIIFENIPEHIVFQDKEHKLIWCNKAACDSVDLSLEQLIGRKCHEIWQNREDVCENCPVEASLKNGKQNKTELTTPDGRIWDIRGYSVRDDKGDVIGAIELTSEITERKRAERKIRKSEEKYRKAYNRSNLYKDLFTHDINNILQNILSSVELSKLYSKDPNNKDKYKEVSNLIKEQIIRGRELVHNVQNLSEIEDVKTPIESIESLSILSKASETIKKSFPYKVINIELKSSETQYFVNANELLINIFENILFNAVKHNIHENIEILIRISKERKNETNNIKFEFLDNGVGIHDSMKPEIFSRNYKEYKKDSVPSGIGLGLLLVNRILDSYNGEIIIEDRIDKDHSKGSNFIILIQEAV